MSDNNTNFLMKQKETLDRGKRGILSVIFGRSGILAILILLQLGTLLMGFELIRDHIWMAYEIMVLLGFVLVVQIINRPGNPVFKIAWIIPILMVPVFGTLFYLFFSAQLNEKKLNKEVLKEMHATEELVRHKKEVLARLEQDNPQIRRLASYLRRTSGSAAYENTSVRYYESGEAAFDTIIEEIRGAKKYIFLEFFIVKQGYMWDSVLEILKAKVKEGVEVRLMYDGMSDYFNLPLNYAKKIRECGVACQVFSPIVPLLSTVQNNRDHRKILIVDGNVAFTGGINLADEYINQKERFGYWKDCCIRLEGDAVMGFTLMFLQMWNVVDAVSREKRKNLKNRKPDLSAYLPYINHTCDAVPEENPGYVIPYADNPLDDELLGETVYSDILNTATKYVHIMTPYLVLDHEMIIHLCYAAKRGVDVKIILPGIPDKRYAYMLAKTFYKELLEAGVEIYEYEPGFIHSKLFVSDDVKAVAGSINMDIRSLYLSFECAAYIYQNKEILRMEEDYQKTLLQCSGVTMEHVKNQPKFEKLCGRLLRLFAPLM